MKIILYSHDTKRGVSFDGESYLSRLNQLEILNLLFSNGGKVAKAIALLHSLIDPTIQQAFDKDVCVTYRKEDVFSWIAKHNPTWRYSIKEETTYLVPRHESIYCRHKTTLYPMDAMVAIAQNYRNDEGKIPVTEWENLLAEAIVFKHTENVAIAREKDEVTSLGAAIAIAEKSVFNPCILVDPGMATRVMNKWVQLTEKDLAYED